MALHQSEDKNPELKSGFMASFLDFLKTGKKQPTPGVDPVDSASVKGGIRPLSPPPPPPPPPPPAPSFSEGEGEGSLGLSSCPSPCKRLDEELKRNLETLPSFSSDEEDSVSKNQDLQKSISSAISALYDTPHSLVAAPPPPTPSPPSPHVEQTPSPINTPPPISVEPEPVGQTPVQPMEDEEEEEVEETPPVLAANDQSPQPQVPTPEQTEDLQQTGAEEQRLVEEEEEDEEEQEVEEEVEEQKLERTRDEEGVTQREAEEEAMDEPDYEMLGRPKVEGMWNYQKTVNSIQCKRCCQWTSLC